MPRRKSYPIKAFKSKELQAWEVRETQREAVAGMRDGGASIEEMMHGLEMSRAVIFKRVQQLKGNLEDPRPATVADAILGVLLHSELQVTIRELKLLLSDWKPGLIDSMVGYLPKVGLLGRTYVANKNFRDARSKYSYYIPGYWTVIRGQVEYSRHLSQEEALTQEAALQEETERAYRTEYVDNHYRLRDGYATFFHPRTSGFYYHNTFRTSFVELMQEKGIPQHEWSVRLSRVRSLGWSINKAIDKPIRPTKKRCRETKKRKASARH